MSSHPLWGPWPARGPTSPEATRFQHLPSLSRGELGFALMAATALIGSVLWIFPDAAVFEIVAALLWFASPGILAARRIYGQTAFAGALLVAPIWGYSLSSMALLAARLLGVRDDVSLVLAPVVAGALAWTVGPLFSGSLRLPRFGRRDALAICFVVLLVPLVVARPYARVGETVPDGKAYRAYFTADFVWAMAVTSEVAKGDAIPRNPYLKDDRLHYYWLAHLFPALEHRLFRRVPLEKLLLVNATLGATGFLLFLYFFTRHFTERAGAALAACGAVVLCTSFEGVNELYRLWRAGAPLDLVRYTNIDAMTRWTYGSMPVDGLQRLLLYQPQHQLGYALGFTALAVLVEAAEAAELSAVALSGMLLGAAFLVSTFAAIMLTLAASWHRGWGLAQRGLWRRAPANALAIGMPIAGAIAVSLVLGYVDEGRSLVTFGLNRIAAKDWVVALGLSFGPIALIALAAVAYAVRRHEIGRLRVPLVVAGVSVLFYFFVDVIDHQDVYVGWRAGHLIFISSAPLCAYLVETLTRQRRQLRLIGFATLVAIGALALPTAVIDLFNTQDIDNREASPAGHWTLVLSPDEIDALAWIRKATPIAARVQVEPTVRDPETWAYIPAFAERRMAAGIPISMVPLEQYRVASRRIRRVYQSRTADDLYSDALRQGIDYLVVTPLERRTYPQLEPLLDSNPEQFAPVFANASVHIYAVGRGHHPS